MGIDVVGNCDCSAGLKMADPEVSVVMPCLNESLTLRTCIGKAQADLSAQGISHEIVIADNGSTDGSQQIATDAGARVIDVPIKGYGGALMGGIHAARGRFVIMGDSDDSYDFANIHPFVHKLREGHDLVMGNRFAGGIEKGAMPFLHKYLGNPVLTFIGRLLFKSPCRDFHCGLRGFSKVVFQQLNLQTTGMEFASEMVIKATMKGLRIGEVPITLHKDGRSRPPHLRSWRDGWRHLRFMLIYSPRWLFLIPGLVVAVLSGLLAVFLYFSSLHIGKVTLDTGTMMLAAMGLLAGTHMAAQAVAAKIFALGAGLVPADPRFTSLFRFFNLEKGIFLGVLFLVAGAYFVGRSALMWQEQGFGELSYSENMRNIIAGGTLIVLGIQAISVSFFLSVLGLQTKRTTPPAL